MEELYNFTNTLSNFTTISENIGIKNLRTLLKFEQFLSKILELECKFQMENNVRSLIELDDITTEVIAKLEVIEYDNGELFNRIKMHFPHLHNEVEHGYINSIIESYCYVLYSIRCLVAKNVSDTSSYLMKDLYEFTNLIANDLLKEFTPYRYMTDEEELGEMMMNVKM
jgi:hypothetical protein